MASEVFSSSGWNSSREGFRDGDREHRHSASGRQGASCVIHPKSPPELRLQEPEAGGDEVQ